MKKILLYLTIFILILIIFLNYSIVLDSTIYAVNLWLYKVFPYLFIMIIINDILISSDFESLFKNNSLYVFVMSLLSGTPTSAYIISNLYKQNKMSKNNANITLLFTYFSNPLFLYTMLNSIFLSKFVTIKLMLIHYLSNLIIFIFYNKKLDNTSRSYNKINVNITDSIKKAMSTTIMVLGTITFYLILSNIINLNIYLKGLLEMTQGLNMLINNSINFKEIIAIVFISFGGLSIHTQVKCILDETDLDYKYYFWGRIYQTIIATILTIFSNFI